MRRRGPGFLGVTLTRFGIKAALTVTRHTGFHQFTFPATTRANVLIDAGSFLGQHYAHASERQTLVGSEVRILDDTTVEGYSRVREVGTPATPTPCFFYAVFDTPATAFGTWKNGRSRRRTQRIRFRANPPAPSSPLTRIRAARCG